MVPGLGDMSISLAVAAMGSALGTGAAGMAAIGAWKKAFIQNKAAPFILVAFVGAPLSQTIYGMILRNAIQAANLPPETMVEFEFDTGRLYSPRARTRRRAPVRH